MSYWLILSATLLGLITAQSIPSSSYGTCSYTGDPHLTPFPLGPGQVSNTYWCQQLGWEILLQNPWIIVTVKVGPSPYVITDYVVMFLDGSGGTSISCFLQGSAGLSTCASGSGISSLVGGGGTSWNHMYPLAQYLNLQITSYLWGSITRYDIIIRETYNMINQSTGVCVKYDCPLESVGVTPPPIIINICNTYISAAQKLLVGRVNEITVRFITIACQNDLTLTFNHEFAKTATAQLIRASLDQTDGEDYQNAAIKADQNIITATANANRVTAALLKQDGACRQEQRCIGVTKSNVT